MDAVISTRSCQDFFLPEDSSHTVILAVVQKYRRRQTKFLLAGVKDTNEKSQHVRDIANVMTTTL